MANNHPYTSAYDNLPKIAKILIQIFLGVIVGGVYRIIRFFETKNLVTLIVGLLTTFTGVGNLIIWIVDLVTQVTAGKISVFAD